MGDRGFARQKNKFRIFKGAVSCFSYHGVLQQKYLPGLNSSSIGAFGFIKHIGGNKEWFGKIFANKHHECKSFAKAWWQNTKN